LKETKEKSKLEYMRKMAKAADAYAPSLMELPETGPSELRSQNARRAI
jgi:hypothetical protein